MFGRQLVSILRRSKLQNCLSNGSSSSRVFNQRPRFFSSELGGSSAAQRNALYGFRSLIKVQILLISLLFNYLLMSNSNKAFKAFNCRKNLMFFNGYGVDFFI